jgi:hypothetical protein
MQQRSHKMGTHETTASTNIKMMTRQQHPKRFSTSRIGTPYRNRTRIPRLRVSCSNR